MFNSRSSISISTFLSSLIGSIVRGRRSVRYGQTCEYRKARLILTHDPGEELFLGALHPAAALFREHIDIPELIAEHATYRRVLEEAGARVLTVRQILLDGTGADGKPADRTKLENLRRFAAGFLTFDTQNLSPETAGQQKEYRQSILAKTSPRDLVRIILRQPIIRLSETQINTGLKAEYSENPVMNLFYTRDQLITTAKGVVIGRMNSPQREKGCDILQFCLEKIGMKPLHRIDGEGAHLEGGDFYPFGDTAFIGCGMRTTQPAIDQLMEHDLLGCNRLVVVKDRLFSQAEMHLDTYFNIIDRNLVTLTARRMTTDPDSPDLLLADIYLRGANGVYHKTSCPLTREQTELLMAGKIVPNVADRPPLLQKLTAQMMTRRLHPVVIVEYERIPFVYKNGNVRITLDTNLVSSSDVSQFLRERIPHRPVMPLGQQLLEVKYDAYLPDFLYQSLQLSDLRQTAYSKYALCRRYTR